MDEMGALIHPSIHPYMEGVCLLLTGPARSFFYFGGDANELFRRTKERSFVRDAGLV